MDQDGVEVYKLEKKKERGQYQAILTDQTWSFSKEDSSIMLGRVANQSVGFHSSRLLTELAI